MLDTWLREKCGDRRPAVPLLLATANEVIQ
jgi:hypothetical protein